ncbi:MAG: phosphoribosylamine--glycine ligase [Candidatus Latescibacteria bacterium]|nr:phosphoribosylamine--glycine ligase [Candidatus Latescibacterota bacterium]
MKVLVVGSGGREHTLVWRLARCPSVTSVIAAPGNVGMSPDAELRAVAVDDLDGMVSLAREEEVDLVVVGPEIPLTLGLADRVREAGIPCFGPGAEGARLEGSKAWAKDLMSRAGIPTSGYRTFTDYGKAIAFLEKGEGPIVVKASGLAAGKGSIVCADRQEAKETVRAIMEEKRFGEAGDTVVIEEKLEGEEASILAITDGRVLLPLVASQDHKAVGEGDTGPNTGGMGAYAPAPVVTGELMVKVNTRVMQPLLDILTTDGIDYRGVIYAGLMIDDEGDPWVIEFNCRFGDPESQVVLPLVEGDLARALLDAANGDLDPAALSIAGGAAVCVVLASGGYPDSYEKGFPIHGLGQETARENLIVFHAGTAEREGDIVTAGGRVLGVTALGDDIASAVDLAYSGCAGIDFEGVYYRRDIAWRALARGSGN